MDSKLSKKYVAPKLSLRKRVADEAIRRPAIANLEMVLLRVSSNWAGRRQTLHFRRRGMVTICSDVRGELVAYELISSFSLSNHYLGVVVRSIQVNR